MLSFFCFFFCAIFSHKSIYPLKKKVRQRSCASFRAFIIIIIIIIILLHHYYYYQPSPISFFFYFFLKIIIIDLFGSWSRWFDFCCTGSLGRRIVFLCVCVFCCTVKTWLFGKKCAGSCTDFGKRSKHLFIYTHRNGRGGLFSKDF